MNTYRAGRRYYTMGAMLAVRQNITSGNWWEITGETCVAAYQAKGAASLAASYVNLANPGTYDAAPGTAPTFDTATGWTFNGTTQYLTTGISPASNMSVAIRFSSAVVSVGNKCIMGARGVMGGGSGLIFWIVGSPITERYYDNGSRVTVSGAVAGAVLCIAGTKGYRDGIENATGLAGTATGPSMYIGATNNNGTASFYTNAQIQAAVIYSTTLDAAQVAQVSAAMAAL